MVSAPPASAGSSRATTITGGDRHSCAIRGHQAYCWGDDTFGELGDNSTTATRQAMPVPVYTGGALSGVTLTQIAAGTNFTCALSSAGAVYCWGQNNVSQLGNSNSPTNSSVPVAVTASGALSGKTISQITAGYQHACALDTAGKAYCWGNNTNGELGDATTSPRTAPVAVSVSGVLSGKTLTQISVGQIHTCALDTAGLAYCWGDNTNGELGNNSITASSSPVAVTSSGVLSGKTLVQITGGANFTCALSSAGLAYCWGSNTTYGELGNGNTTDQHVAVAVVTSGALSGKTLNEISASAFGVCALGSTGVTYCWGNNGDGEFGNGNTTSSSVPVATTTSGVLSGKTLTQVTNGYYQTCALDSAGTAYCWGQNSSGQVGNTDTGINFLLPVLVSWAQPTTISAGVSHSCVLRGGKAYCWGDNTFGQLGNNSTISSGVPVPVYTGGALAGVTLIQISAGNSATCALSSTGAAYCWGYNGYGELGNNSNTDSRVPVAVSTSGVLLGVTLTAIANEYTNVCALSSTGAAYCWGQDNFGQLGNNNGIVNSSVPVALYTGGVLSGVTLTQIVTGTGASCALGSTGGAYCWGYDGFGGLGNGTTSANPQSTPVLVSGGLTLAGISAGTYHACALTGPGAAYCWGDNANGELGNNSTTASNVPVAVTSSGVLSGVTLVQITAGGFTTCALDSAGLPYCWGNNQNGQLGNNSITESHVPVAVSTSGVLAGVDLTQLSNGGGFTCGLSGAGAGYCWGLNSSGEAGNTDTGVNFRVPATVAPSQPVTLAAGNAHTCKISSGKAYCWGDN